MQNVANWKDDIDPGQEVTAIDARDNKTYTVAKLADGNLWMTQNLDHDIVTDGTVTYDSTTTDLPVNTTWLPERATYASNVTHWNDYDETENPTGVDGLNHPESYDPGELYWDGTISDGSSNQTSSTGDPHYHLGNYYNWTAAVAMNDSSSYTIYDSLVEQSICPAGWTLPRTGTGKDSFAALWNAYNFNESSFTDANSNSTWDSGENALWTSPLYFAASGYWYGALYAVGSNGNFWSPVVYNDRNARGANFDTNGYVYPGYDDYRDSGNSVRCVARPVASTVSFD